MTTSAARDFIITPEAVQTAGSVTYWRLTGPIDLAVFAKAWAAAGLDTKMLPKAPGLEVALGRAVRDQSGRNRMVRRMKNGTWLVVDETPAADGTTAAYNVIAAVALAATGPSVTFQDAPLGFDHAKFLHQVQSAFAAHQGQLEADDISSWLVKVAQQLRAVSLRDTGGIYFIPSSTASLWGQITNVVRSVSSHQVFSIPAMKNADAIAAITAAITEEAAQVVERMYEDLQKTGDDALGKKALKTRTVEAMALLAKVDEYEQLVESRLTVRQRVEELQAALATAAFAAEGE